MRPASSFGSGIQPMHRKPTTKSMSGCRDAEIFGPRDDVDERERASSRSPPCLCVSLSVSPTGQQAILFSTPTFQRERGTRQSRRRSNRRVAERAPDEPWRRRQPDDERAPLHLRLACFVFFCSSFIHSRSICCGVFAQKYRKCAEFPGICPMPQP
jgi:hypothetical protein